MKIILALLARVDWLFALVRQLIATGAPAAQIGACVVRLERETAAAIRFTLISAQIDCPGLSDRDLIGWFNRERPLALKRRRAERAARPAGYANSSFPEGRDSVAARDGWREYAKSNARAPPGVCGGSIVSKPPWAAPMRGRRRWTDYASFPASRLAALSGPIS